MAASSCKRARCFSFASACGELMAFLHRPISAWLIGGCAVLILAQLPGHARRLRAEPCSGADSPPQA
jgi:hypothetical protein